MVDDLAERRKVQEELLAHDEFWMDAGRDLFYLDIKDLIDQKFGEWKRPLVDFNKVVLKAIIDIAEELARDI